MNDRRQRSLSKIYKDLIITKRDLIDLRESIHQTIDSIKQSDQQLQYINQRRRITSLSSATPITPTFYKAQAPDQKVLINQEKKFKCIYCNVFYENLSDLNKHKSERHRICYKCKQIASQNLKDHLAYTCGEERFPCHECNLMIKKRDLDQHIKICCFRQCFKCRSEIYVSALAYHLQSCGKDHRRKRQKEWNFEFDKLSKDSYPQIIPCCIILNRQGK